MTERDISIPIRIGHTGDEPWEAMHRADQRLVRFKISFEELPAPPLERDYRASLEQLWGAFLGQAGLATAIFHVGWHPEKGPPYVVFGFVWRHVGTERFDTVSEPELLQLVELLRAPGSRVRGFVLTELISTARFQQHLPQQEFTLRHGEYTVEQLSE